MGILDTSCRKEPGITQPSQTCLLNFGQISPADERKRASGAASSLCDRQQEEDKVGWGHQHPEGKFCVEAASVRLCGAAYRRRCTDHRQENVRNVFLNHVNHNVKPKRANTEAVRYWRGRRGALLGAEPEQRSCLFCIFSSFNTFYKMH